MGRKGSHALWSKSSMLVSAPIGAALFSKKIGTHTFQPSQWWTIRCLNGKGTSGKHCKKKPPPWCTSWALGAMEGTGRAGRGKGGSTPHSRPRRLGRCARPRGGGCSRAHAWFLSPKEGFQPGHAHPNRVGGEEGGGSRGTRKCGTKFLGALREACLCLRWRASVRRPPARVSGPGLFLNHRIWVVGNRY